MFSPIMEPPQPAADAAERQTVGAVNGLSSPDWGFGAPARVSIVIISHCRRDLLIRCLESCAKQTYGDLQVVVVLNPAVPGQAEELATSFPEARVIRTHRNLGFFPALNIAIANADGDYVMTVDDDAYFLDDRLVSRFVETFRSEPRLAAVTCNIEGPHEAPPVPQDRYVDLFKTGFAMLPRRIFTDPSLVGYYPEAFFRSAGETYVCTRAWDLDMRVKQLAVTGMYHDLTTRGRSVRDWSFHGLRSQILCTLMRDPWLVVLPRLISMFARSLFHHLKWRRPMRWWIYAWWSALTHLPTAFAHRTPIRLQTVRRMRRLRAHRITDESELGR